MLLRAAHGARFPLDVARYSLLASSRDPTPTFLASYCLRHASTVQRHNVPPKSRASPPTIASTNLNPPISTLPPPLDVPTRQDGQSTATHLFALGKAYLSFYKAGLKAVWTNRQAAQALRRAHLGGRTPAAAAEAGALTRGQWQLLRRSTTDARRIPLFILLFAACGELTPLVVIFASPLVPGTCRIPRQVAHERTKRQARRHTNIVDIGAERLATNGAAAGWDVNALRRQELLHVGRSLALYGRTWDRLLGGLPTIALRPRVRRHLAYLALDDALLRRGGGSAALSDAETIVACEERGIDVLQVSQGERLRSADELRRELTAWLEATEQRPMTELILVR